MHRAVASSFVFGICLVLASIRSCHSQSKYDRHCCCHRTMTFTSVFREHCCPVSASVLHVCVVRDGVAARQIDLASTFDVTLFPKPTFYPATLLGLQSSQDAIDTITVNPGGIVTVVMAVS